MLFKSKDNKFDDFSYDVLAIEVPSGAKHAQFWILGKKFLQRQSDGIVRPDIIDASECSLVNNTIPKNWIVAINRYGEETRTIFSPPEFSVYGYLEMLLNGNEHAIETFNKMLAAHFRHDFVYPSSS